MKWRGYYKRKYCLFLIKNMANCAKNSPKHDKMYTETLKSKHFPPTEPVEAISGGTAVGDHALPPKDIDWYTYTPSDDVWLYEVKKYVPAKSRRHRRSW